MPSGGRILCGLCADDRCVLVAGLDESRQLHLLAARPGQDRGSQDRAAAGQERSGGARAAALRETPSSAMPAASASDAAGGYGGFGGSYGGGLGVGGGPSTSFDRFDATRDVSDAALARLPHAVDILKLDGSGESHSPSKEASSKGDGGGQWGGSSLAGYASVASKRVGSARAGRRAQQPSGAPPVNLQ